MVSRILLRITMIVAVFCAAMTLVASSPAQVQEKVLYNFCSAAPCTDGSEPWAELVADASGNLYGTTAFGGANDANEGGYGTVFELSPTQDGTWTETVLYSFTRGEDFPMAGLIFDKAGNLYGTTSGANGPGTVFRLAPPAHPGGTWTETTLWRFGGQNDGSLPRCHLALDASGNLYGTTENGGKYGSSGTVFVLQPPKSGDQWSEQVLYSFGLDPTIGILPIGGVTLDALGNVYGTTTLGGRGGGSGVIFELIPQPNLPWKARVLYTFDTRSGLSSHASMIFDKSGNLYGTTWGPPSGVFRINPNTRHLDPLIFQGSSPGGVALVGGDLYGTTYYGGSGYGTVFRIHGGKEADLYKFCSQPGCVDGGQPQGTVIAVKGSLFGTAFQGGKNGKGVVFQISKAANQ